jgi:hypothetical protein
LNPSLPAKNAARLIGTSELSPPQHVAGWAKEKNLAGVGWTVLRATAGIAFVEARGDVQDIQTPDCARRNGGHMNITLASASALVDQFEQLLAAHSISVPKNPQTGADMLPLWQLLQAIRGGALQSSQPDRHQYAAALAAHDLAAKVMEVRNSPQFPKLLPHLQILADGAIHLTLDPPARSDGYNKLIELYWACLCVAERLDIELDHPEAADGSNPDIITNAPPGVAKRGYAFKTIRSLHTQSIFEHLQKGIDQIEKSASIVALHLTPRMQLPILWPQTPFPDWRIASSVVIDACRQMLAQLIHDNGQAAIDELFRGKKAVSSVLCIVFAPTLAISPLTSLTTVMPLKVPALISLGDQNPISADFFAEVAMINHQMQTVL